jgi:diaminopimelate decarboxylase
MTESIIHLKDNKNYIEEVELDEICQSFGTPSYVYSKKNIVDSYNKLDKAFHKHERLICFAVKANPNIAILNILANLGAGFDIVSGGELRRVIAAKAILKKLYFLALGNLLMK